MAQPTGRDQMSPQLRACRVDFCEGQLLPIPRTKRSFTHRQITAATGKETCLPDSVAEFRSSGNGPSSRRRARGGSHVTVTQIPAHSHPFLASTDQTTRSTRRHVLGGG